MTRETKIGLIVAGSFLCLVCIVVASKWRRGEDPSEEQTIQVAAANPTQNSNAPDTKKPDTSKGNGGQPGDSKPKMPGAPETPMMMIPPQVAPGDFPRMEIPVPKPQTELPGAPAPTPGPIAPLAGGIPMPPQIGGNLTSTAPLFPPVSPITPAEAPGLGLKLPASLVEDKKPLLIPDAPKAPGLGVAEPLAPVLPPSLDPIKPIIAPPAKPEAITFSFTDKDQPPTIPTLKTKEGVPMFPPLETPNPLNKDGIPSAPTFPMTPKPTVETPMVPPITDTAPRLIPKIPSSDLPSAPPITPPTLRALPIVKDASIDDYMIQPGDTNFAIVSRRVYGSEKYGDALWAYNRKHYTAVADGTNLLFNPPLLNPGQRVLKPSSLDLEKEFGSLIRDTSVSAIPTIPPTTPTVKISTPVPLVAGPGPAVPTIPVAASGQGRTYRVANPAGESILDIAERNLGNRGLWTEIYRINQTNPAVRPPALIPAGTDLKLP